MYSWVNQRLDRQAEPRRREVKPSHILKTVLAFGWPPSIKWLVVLRVRVRPCLK